MATINEYLQALVTMGSSELRLEPNKEPYVVTADGNANVGTTALDGPQISMMVFPLIPLDVKKQLPDRSEIEFVHPHKLCSFGFVVKKSPAGFVVTVRPDAGGKAKSESQDSDSAADAENLPEFFSSDKLNTRGPAGVAAAYSAGTISISGQNAPLPLDDSEQGDGDSATDVPDGAGTAETGAAPMDFDLLPSGFVPPLEEYVPEPESGEQAQEPRELAAVQLVERRKGDRREVNSIARDNTDALLRMMCEAGASDLHLSAGVRPMLRKDGNIEVTESGEPLSAGDAREQFFAIMPPKNREEFASRGDTDFTYDIPGLARFRCNVFTDRRGPCGVFRMIPNAVPPAEQLGLPKAILELCSRPDGLIVVTGSAGSGRSTTLAAMVDSVNKSRTGHIITIEDPIEFIHENEKCLVNQREVRSHTDSSEVGLHAALREDPDVLLIGDLRGHATLSGAILAAASGRLVFGAMHAPTAVLAIDSMIGQFSAGVQEQVRESLSESLCGVIAQSLVPIKGGGRVAAFEVMVVTPAIQCLIREGRTDEIISAMKSGKSDGMVTLDDSLFDLVEQGIAEPRDAYMKAPDKTSFEAKLSNSGFSI